MPILCYTPCMRDQYKLLLLTIAGSSFAGYLAAGKFLTGNCTLSVSCSCFLGYPTCYYGFAMFALMLLLSIGYIITNNKLHAKLISVVAMLGIIFSSYFSFIEIMPMITSGTIYGLILPSCTYGLVVYLIVLYISYKNSEE